MDAQIYRQRSARARSGSLHVSVADLASASTRLSRYTRAAPAVRRAVTNVLERSNSDAASCFLSLFVPTGSRWSSEAQRKKERKKEPLVLSFPMVLGEFGGGVFDPRVPVRASVRWECSATAALHASSD